MDEINLNSKITREEDLLSGILDDEIVIMSIESGNYHIINKTGQRIWELMEQPITVSKICSTILEEYDVDPDICQKEVLHFIAGLFSRQIVIVS